MFGEIKLNVTQWEERGVDPTASSAVVVINFCMTKTQLIHKNVYDSSLVSVPRFHQQGSLSHLSASDGKRLP